MNRERAKELLPIIQAYAEGADILYEGTQCMIPSFDDDSGHYEVKPEPEVIYVNKLSGFCGGQARMYPTVLEANKAAPLGGGSDYEYIAKKFIEAGE